MLQVKLVSGKHLLEYGADLFSTGKDKKKGDDEALLSTLYAKIGRLEMELDFLKKKLGQ